MENSRIIQEFLDYLGTEKHFSQYTIKNYGSDLTQFAEFLTLRANSTNLKLDTLLLSTNTKDIEAFLAFLEKEGYIKVSIARKISALSSFYKFLVRRNKVSLNPVKKIGRPKVVRKAPDFLGYEKIQKLLETPSLDNWLGARDRAILEVLYGTGMKVGEIVTLNINDIDFLSKVVHIRREGKKERILPISSAVLALILHYMEIRNKKAQGNPKFDNEILFVNGRGKQLSTRSIRRKMKKYLKIAGLEEKINPTTLRHSFARHILDSSRHLNLKSV